MRFWFTAVFIFMLISPVFAQDAACGIVDAVDYPIDNMISGYDDFGLFRARFGGNHTGIDIGFDRWGEPVRAAARGRVTLADVEEWDTEKGVVIIEHRFPDDSIAYSLYGHMEQTDTITFPRVGDCVERGTILGSIGWPSRGRPHLHYEIRRILPTDGGPGYVTVSPLTLGWYHPLDFTELWRIRLQPGFAGSVTFQSVPGLPPVMLSGGAFAVASGSSIEGISPDGSVQWRVETDGVITGIAALSGDRVIAHTRNGQALALQNGRYAALWTVRGLEEPFLMLGESLVFATEGAGLSAFAPDGTPLWTLPPVSTGARLINFETNGQQIALGVRSDDGQIVLRLISADGRVEYEAVLENLPVLAPDRSGNWYLLDGAQLKRLGGGQNHDLATVGSLAGRWARAEVDLLGNSYFFMNDAANSLLSLDAEGRLRWRIDYPFPTASLPPLLRTGGGCMLYTLDADGMLNVFDTTTGSLINQVKLYAGGDQTRSPRARLLQVGEGEQVRVGGGFLSVVDLDGWALGGDQAANCRLG